jgi:uncharacterized protein
LELFLGPFFEPNELGRGGTLWIDVDEVGLLVVTQPGSDIIAEGQRVGFEFDVQAHGAPYAYVVENSVIVMGVNATSLAEVVEYSLHLYDLEMPTTPNQIPMVDYLVLEADAPHLVAQECVACGALFFDRRNGCARCGAQEFQAKPLSSTGIVRSYTIVHRAAPKVPAPYISAVVELDGGGVIKANLVGVEALPEAVRLGGRVRLVTFVAGTDDDGTEALAFGFTQDEGATAQ